MSLPQKPRTQDEEATFRRGLNGMGVLYAHPATAVVQVKSVPERPRALDGCVIAFTGDLALVKRRGLDGLRQCELTPERNVRMRFATHEHAQRAIQQVVSACTATDCKNCGARLKSAEQAWGTQLCNPCWDQTIKNDAAPPGFSFALCLEYNDRPYDERGWVSILSAPWAVMQASNPIHCRALGNEMCLRSAWARSRGPSS